MTLAFMLTLEAMAQLSLITNPPAPNVLLGEGIQFNQRTPPAAFVMGRSTYVYSQYFGGPNANLTLAMSGASSGNYSIYVSANHGAAAGI